MPDALPVPEEQDELPPILPYPVSVNIRNSDLGVDEGGNATRMSETRIVLSMRSHASPGTVFFTAINMRAMNATARGLIRVLSQRPLEDGIGIETFAEFVEFSDDAKAKVRRLLGNGSAATIAPPPATRNFATDQLGVQPVYQRGGPPRTDFQVASTERTYFEPAPLRQQATATTTTKFWGSLGVTAYVIAFLCLVAFFPAGREIELMVWGKIVWILERMWFWANHVGEVKLYNNS
jgi:hypothetical protein